MTVKTYDPKNVQLIVGGVPINGFADGTFISAERTNDAFTMVSGAAGEVTRAKSNDRTGMVTITLLQSSLSNDVLSGFALADELSNSGIVPVVIKEVTGNTVIFSGEGWVRKFPVTDYAKEVSNREWVLDMSDMDFFIGGNA